MASITPPCTVNADKDVDCDDNGQTKIITTIHVPKKTTSEIPKEIADELKKCVFIIDASSSMRPYAQQVIRGVNYAIAELKQSATNHLLLSIYTFNSTIAQAIENKPIS